MLHKLLTIAKNTFTETLRQPIYAIIIVAALLSFLLSPSLTMYTMSDDNKLLRELSLSTLFLSGLFIAIFSASGAVAEEIERKTITTILSKPVPRPIFIIGKFLGVTAAVALAHYICTAALLMTVRHGVIESVAETHDWTVIIAAAGALLGTLLLTAFLNYFYDWKFSSTAVLLASLAATFALLFLSFIDRNWQFNPAENHFNSFDIYASILLFFAVVIIVALAIAFSTRFNIVVTLGCCIGIFLLGLISDYVFGRFSDAHIWARFGRIIIPNLQVFWISDAIYEGNPVPGKYILIASSYAVCYSVAVLLFAITFFQRRQVG